MILHSQPTRYARALARRSALTGSLLGALLFSQIVAAHTPYTNVQDFKSDDQLACWTVFSATERDTVPQTLCDRCLQEIQTKAVVHDRVKLFRALDSARCSVKETPLPEGDFTGWTLLLDQDYLTFDSWTDLNHDRNYTMGIGFLRTGSQYRQGFLAAIRNTLDRGGDLFDHRAPIEIMHSLEYGITAFTPNELEIKEAIPGDRPYAGLVYGANAKLIAFADDYAIKSKFVLGVLGLDAAKHLQRWLHNEVGLAKADPLGWDNQISEGGEPTFLYSVQKSHLWNKSSHWDISYTYGAELGYYTDVVTGFDVRLGKVISPYYCHNGNPMSEVNHFSCATCGGRDRYLFASYRARLVGYNALLQGQFRHSNVSFSHSEVERLLHEASVGFKYRFFEKWFFTYALTYKSAEFKGPHARAHWFGGIYLGKKFSD